MWWPFFFVLRRGYSTADQWDTMFIRNRSDAWDFLSYSYELPWIEDETGNSVKNKSRIQEGTYELNVRETVPKAGVWNCSRRSTEPTCRSTAPHKSMYIHGCILPVHFEDFRVRTSGSAKGIKKGDKEIQARSEDLMALLRARYESLKSGKEGRPTITIAATLPAMLETRSATAYV